MPKKSSQQTKILNYLRTYKSITQLDAYNHFASFSLAKIISNLRKKGFGIETIRREGVNRFGDKVHYGEYVLKTEPSICDTAPFSQCNNAEGCDTCPYGDKKNV